MNLAAEVARQPGMAAIWACTGASPSPLAICGLPPESSTGFAAFERASLGAGCLALA